ncbi:MAG: hypothetical protein MJK12_08295 [Colwellia sp.]|nr:hypothetical protein [Colwellia sp.]
MNNENNDSVKIDDSVNYKTGYNFEFSQGENIIRAFGSAKSGKEQVFFNDALMAEKRSFGLKSCLSFQSTDYRYEVEFHIANIFTGELHCTLIRDGVHVQTLKQSLAKKYQLNGKTKLLFLISQGFFAGFILVMAIDYFFNVFGK